MKGLFGWNFPVARKVGKAFGIGLDENEQRARDMSFGNITSQEQIDIATGRLNPDTGSYAEPSAPVNPEQARVASRYGAQAQGAGRSLDQSPSDLYSEEQSDSEAGTWSGKPANEWTNAEVEELQNNLNNAGYTDMDGKKLTVDGMLGARTVSALRKSQGAFGRGDRAQEATSPPFSGPQGDQSSTYQGIGDESTGFGASSGARDEFIQKRPTDPETGEVTPEAYQAGPPPNYEEPSVLNSAKRVGKSYWDYLSGNQGFVPDLWQGK
jgi:hypothetical protein